MKLIKSLAVASVMMIATAASAQKLKFESGDGLAFLKDQYEMNVEYDYSKITVSGGPEADYVKTQKADRNADEAGTGDEFEKEWTEARASKYQVHFAKEFNKMFKGEKDSINVKEGSSAKYTLIITAMDMELGKGKLLIKKPALISFECQIVETANRSNVVAKFKLDKVEGEVNAPKGSGWIPGAGGVMATTATVQNRSWSNRLAESYEKAGGAIAKYIKKNVK